jgi:hypothetical protein
MKFFQTFSAERGIHEIDTWTVPIRGLALAQVKNDTLEALMTRSAD